MTKIAVTIDDIREAQAVLTGQVDYAPGRRERVVELCIAIKEAGEEQALMSALVKCNYAPQYSRWLDPPV